MKDELILKGKQIIEELGGENESLLRKWMAHYLAELMKKAQSANEEEARTASEQCSKIILELWAQKIDKEVTQLKYRFKRLINSSSDDEIDYDNLRAALSAPETIIKAGQMNQDAIAILRSLSKLEYQLLHLLAISEAINTETEVADESIERFTEIETDAKDIIQDISLAFPAFAELELTDLMAARQQIGSALLSIYRLREMLPAKEA